MSAGTGSCWTAGCPPKSKASAAMPHGGLIRLYDIDGKLETLRVECRKCGRAGRYNVERLISERGRDLAIGLLLDELKATCPKSGGNDIYDRCLATCPDLSAVV